MSKSPKEQYLDQLIDEEQDSMGDGQRREARSDDQLTFRVTRSDTGGVHGARFPPGTGKAATVVAA